MFNEFIEAIKEIRSCLKQNYKQLTDTIPNELKELGDSFNSNLNNLEIKEKYEKIEDKFTKVTTDIGSNKTSIESNKKILIEIKNEILIKNTELSKKNTELEKENSIKDSKIVSLTSDIDKRNNHIKEKENALNERNTKIQKLENDIKQKDTEYSELKTDLENKKKELDEVKKEKDKLKKEFENYEEIFVTPYKTVLNNLKQCPSLKDFIKTEGLEQTNMKSIKKIIELMGNKTGFIDELYKFIREEKENKYEQDKNQNQKMTSEEENLYRSINDYYEDKTCFKLEMPEKGNFVRNTMIGIDKSKDHPIYNGICVPQTNTNKNAVIIPG